MIPFHFGLLMSIIVAALIILAFTINAHYAAKARERAIMEVVDRELAKQEQAMRQANILIRWRQYNG